MSDLRGTLCLRFDSFLKAEEKHFSAPPLYMLNIAYCTRNAWTPTHGKLEWRLLVISDTSHKTVT